ncbi:TetR/AcrR family transcriptional regulator [Pseudemcibacter aquimaris]|uniref:TetR/AcrR family transcriptional regulator n=1 Tax=Pseudemcibacter aquimaris TaxID=2857064 RepID=UPI002012B52F|nr:TetR/AcrR family transcriptional regulator [Pseudemcibacter aquimaris]MCC3861592.1 TetR/AcrR family transcriptional regulator [Pseudemcibacter aquimaris]WDU58361.1 TetR/AcrR family transcriptional regulator [Pseudemcibacter aquimaris]
MNTKKSTYHHGNLREVLISSALEILKEGTLQDLSLRALARKAGVSQTAPYRHFEDKEALIVVLISEGSALLQEHMVKACQGTDDPVEQLINMGVAYYDFSQDYSAHFRLMFGGSLEDKEKHAHLFEQEKKGYDVLEQVISNCMKLPHSPELSPRLIRLTSWSLVHGLASLILNDVMNDDVPKGDNKREVVSEVISFYTRSMFEK